jgi:anti-sigma factor RsiW
LNCKDVIREVSNYLDGELDAATMQELSKHLSHCGHCKLVVDQTKLTIEIFCDSQAVLLPSEVRGRLHDALRRKMAETNR